MIERLRGLVGRPGPVGALVLGALVGTATGVLALNVVLAGWTYRDAARRDLRSPGRWALAVVVAGPLALGPYVARQWYRDGKGTEGAAETPVASERPAERDALVDDAQSTRQVASDAAAAGPAATRGTAAGRGEADQHGASLASASLSGGAKAAKLGLRGARWAVRRAVARMNND